MRGQHTGLRIVGNPNIAAAPAVRRPQIHQLQTGISSYRDGGLVISTGSLLSIQLQRTAAQLHGGDGGLHLDFEGLGGQAGLCRVVQSHHIAEGVGAASGRIVRIGDGRADGVPLRVICAQNLVGLHGGGGSVFGILVCIGNPEKVRGLIAAQLGGLPTVGGAVIGPQGLTGKVVRADLRGTALENDGSAHALLIKGSAGDGFHVRADDDGRYMFKMAEGVGTQGGDARLHHHGGNPIRHAEPGGAVFIAPIVQEQFTLAAQPQLAAFTDHPADIVVAAGRVGHAAAQNTGSVGEVHRDIGGIAGFRPLLQSSAVIQLRVGAAGKRVCADFGAGGNVHFFQNLTVLEGIVRNAGRHRDLGYGGVAAVQIERLRNGGYGIGADTAKFNSAPAVQILDGHGRRYAAIKGIPADGGYGFGDENAFHAVAVGKGAAADGLQLCRKDQAGEAGAIFKRAVTDFRQTGGQAHRFQLPAAIERAFADAGHALLNPQGFDVVLEILPGRPRVVAKVIHSSGAGNDQRAVPGDGPCQILPAAAEAAQRDTVGLTGDRQAAVGADSHPRFAASRVGDLHSAAIQKRALTHGGYGIGDVQRIELCPLEGVAADLFRTGGQLEAGHPLAVRVQPGSNAQGVGILPEIDFCPGGKIRNVNPFQTAAGVDGGVGDGGGHGQLRHPGEHGQIQIQVFSALPENHMANLLPPGLVNVCVDGCAAEQVERSAVRQRLPGCAAGAVLNVAGAGDVQHAVILIEQPVQLLTAGAAAVAGGLPVQAAAKTIPHGIRPGAAPVGVIGIGGNPQEGVDDGRLGWSIPQEEHVFQGAGFIEGVFSQRLEAHGEHQLRQAGAALKGKVPDGLNRIGQRQTGELVTVKKGSITDGGQALRQGYGFQVFRVFESVAGQIGNALAHRHALDCAVMKDCQLVNGQKPIQVPLGTGQLDMRAILKRIKAYGPLHR